MLPSRSGLLVMNGLVLVFLVVAFTFSGGSPGRASLGLVWLVLPSLLVLMALVSSNSSRLMLGLAGVANAIWSLLLLRMVISTSVSPFWPGIIVGLFALMLLVSALSTAGCWLIWKTQIGNA